MKKIWISWLIGLMTLSLPAFSQQVYTSFSSGKLNFLVPGSHLIPKINYFLNHTNSFSRQLVKTRSKRGSVSNFRTTFIDRKIRVRFNYSIGKRVCNKKPIVGGWYCTPWLSDSGWVEIDVWPSIYNWQFGANTRSGYVRWSSNNWFTNSFVKPFIDNDLRKNIANEINYAVAEAIGQRTLNLKQLILQRGAPTLSRNLKISQQAAVNKLLKLLTSQTSLNAYINRDGLNVSLSLNKFAVSCIFNRTNRTINYSYKWGSKGTWINKRIGPNQNTWFAYGYKNGKQSSPDLIIGFYADQKYQNIYKSYNLKRFAAPERKCNLGKKYKFSLQGNHVNLYLY